MHRLSVLPLSGLLMLAASCDDESSEAPEHERALPEAAYCEQARDWTSAHAELETRVLARIAAHRSAGADCGEHGRFPPAAALVEHGVLRCAARVHVLDMAERMFVAHRNPDDEGAADRVAHAGGRFASLSEAIAAGDIAPERVVDEIWMASPGSCAALMGDTFRFVGVGAYVDDEADPEDGSRNGWWTVMLAH